MSQRHTDGMIPEWFERDGLEAYLELLAPPPSGVRCRSCGCHIETRYYHEDQNGGFWCDVCMARTPGLFWLRERGKG